MFDRISLPDMLWTLVTDLRTPGLLRAWLDAVASLPELHRTPFWESEIGRQGVWLIPNRVYTAEREKPKHEQDWDGLLRELGDDLARVRPLNQPRLEAALTGMMLVILGEQKRLDDTPAVAWSTLSRWPDDADVQFMVLGPWGRQYAYRKRTDDALRILESALSQPNTGNDNERLRCLIAANICVGAEHLHYAEQARDLAREADDVSDIEIARALGEYALSAYQSQGGRSGAIAVYAAWSESLRRFFDAARKDKYWRDLFPLFAHGTSFLSLMAREGRPPEHACDGGTFVVPTRGFLMSNYMPEREALYRESGEAAAALLMGVYAAAAGAGEDAARWMAIAMDGARRTGATALQVAAGGDAIAEMLAVDRFEDAVEMGVFVGRGLVTRHATASERSGDFEGLGVDLRAEFAALPEDRCRQGDNFALIFGVLPAAIKLVRLSLAEPERAVAAGHRVAVLCRELVADERGDQELWRTAAELFESSSVGTNAGQIIALTRTIEGDGEREATLRVLGYVLAAWHASLEEAISYHLSVMPLLLLWYPAGEGVRRRLVIPYIESYWRHAARECRFAFRIPDLTVAGIEAALSVPEADRIYAVLSAAAVGFRIHGLHEALQRIRPASPTSVRPQ